MAKYIYPHVNITNKEIKKRRVPTPAYSTATTLLAPFTCDRGPENELVPVDTIADFENLYGVLDYTKEDQRQILNIGKWLSSGGRVLACRLTDNNKGTRKGVAKSKDVKIGEQSIIFKKSDENGTEAYTAEAAPDGVQAAVLESEPVYTFIWEAKYSGSYYNNINVSIIQTKTNKNLFNVIVSTESNIILEKYSNLEIAKFYKIADISEYIKFLQFGTLTAAVPASVSDDASVQTATFSPVIPASNAIFKQGSSKNLSLSLSADNGGKDVENWLTADSESNTISETKTISNLISSLAEIVKQPLATPFDMFIDCGYPDKIKKELSELFTGKMPLNSDRDKSVTETFECEPRTDAFLVLSTVEISNSGVSENDCKDVDPMFDRVPEYFNVAVYDQYAKIVDLYSKYNGREVYVPATYFIADLVPFNDISYGVQFPTAGLTRGVLKGAKWINKIPSNKEKQEHYEKGINYIERDDRGQYIMTQLTYTSDDTALKFVNNSRSLLKMKKMLLRSARRYIHEFNDGITRSNLLNTLNTDISNWIQNRTLSYGSVKVYDYNDDDTLTNEELVIQLDIRFTNTIEIISIEFTVE